MSARFRDTYAQDEAWNEKVETNSEKLRSEVIVIQANSVR